MNMKEKKVYAVLRGKKPGLYHDWPSAREQVYGFPGAVYRGFPSENEARQWLSAGGTDNPAKSGLPKKKSPPAMAPAEPGPGETIIYTDGAALGNPGPGGFGALIMCQGQQTELSGAFSHTTNNRMEMLAVIKALESLPKTNLPVRIFSDSSYLVNGINRGWAEKWRRNGWLKPDKTEARNRDLWSRLLDLLVPLQASFHWLRGHAGNQWNEYCDRLAVNAARNGPWERDHGFS
jgi:ribonuclease HI